MNKIITCLFLFALYFCASEAATKKEVFNTISNVGHRIRAEKNAALQRSISKIYEGATSYTQRSCVSSKRGDAYEYLNSSLGKELGNVRKEYGRMSISELEQLNLDTVAEELNRRFSAVLTSFDSTVEQILKCA